MALQEGRQSGERPLSRNTGRKKKARRIEPFRRRIDGGIRDHTPRARSVLNCARNWEKVPASSEARISLIRFR